MSDRERWVIYPLLFFSLSMAVKNKITMTTGFESQTLRCQRLIVESMDGKRGVQLGISQNHAGEVQVFDALERTTLKMHSDAIGGGGQMEVFQNGGDAQVVIGAGRQGGSIRLPGIGGIPSLFVGHQEHREVSGVLATDAQGTLQPWLNLLPWPADDDPSEDDAQQNGDDTSVEQTEKQDQEESSVSEPSDNANDNS